MMISVQQHCGGPYPRSHGCAALWSCRRPSLGMLLLLFVLLQLPPVAHGILQTLTLRVMRSDAPSNTATYDLLASQAFFGKYPSMDRSKNPELILTLPPSNNPLLCQKDKSVIAGGGESYTNKTIFVPRGDCTFETKAWVAQRLGAGAIIIYGTLASRYSLNITNQTGEYTYSETDIIFPQQYYDYDCQKGQAMIPRSALSFDPLPYNANRNDPILSRGGASSYNLCWQRSLDHLQNCESQACLLTGNYSADGQAMEACCAWDMHIWLYPDETMTGGDDDDVNVNVNVNVDNKNTIAKQPNIKITAAYITMQQGQQLLQDLRQNTVVTVILSARWKPKYNISSILVWALGVTVAALASYWTASDYHELTQKVMMERKRQHEQQHTAGHRSSTPTRPLSRPAASMTSDQEILELTAWHALGFIVMASSSLLILFYFKIYNVVKVFYAFGCSTALSQVALVPTVTTILESCNGLIPLNPYGLVWRSNTEDLGDIVVRDVISYPIGFAIGLTWLIMAFTVRNPEDHTFFWMTQNIFGACMCIMFMKVIRLNSIRVACILLIVAFVYDIFFVFITPLLFQGKSVMITVATSGGPPKADASWCEKYPNDADCQGGNPLPMLLAIPRFLDYQGGSSLLGLGDIVLPGLLLSFAARFDAAKSLLGVMGGGSGTLTSYSTCPEQELLFGSTCTLACGLCRGGYFAPSVVAYAVGLLMANMAVYWMNMGQPALLYLVPCCLGAVAYIGWRRGEWRDLWDGPKILRAADRIVYGENLEATSSINHEPLPTEDLDEEDRVDHDKDGIVVDDVHRSGTGHEKSVGLTPVVTVSSTAVVHGNSERIQ